MVWEAMAEVACHRMWVKYRVRIDALLFDRDTAFNTTFRTHLLSRDVAPDVSGAYDHWELGSIEKYWDTWQSLVSAFLLSGGLDESYWKFAAQMANYTMMRLPTSSNLGFISPIEALTNEVQNLSHLRVPFSASYVTQAATGALECKARKGIFIGYPEHTRDGVYHGLCRYLR
jgi:hypothetical protein